MALNFVAILLAIGGILNPVVGALVHNAGSVLVIINRLAALKKKLDPCPLVEPESRWLSGFFS